MVGGHVAKFSLVSFLFISGGVESGLRFSSKLLGFAMPCI